MNNLTRRWVVLIAAVAGVAVTARLGVWQLSRAAQKIALQSSIDERGAMPVLSSADLARAGGDVAAQVNRRVTLTGRWLPQFNVFLDNRQMDGRTGFYVLTPLELAPGDAVLVERGWAPRDIRDRALLPAVPTPTGPVRIDGRIALAPSRLYEFAQGETGVLRQNLDIGAYAREIGVALRPLTVLQLDAGGAADADAPATASTVPDGLRRDWPKPAVDVQRHYGYAFQWFALALLLTGLYVWFQLLQPWLRHRRRARG